MKERTHFDPAIIWVIAATLAIAAIIAIVAIIANTFNDGGCEYKEIYGTATITSIVSAGSNDYNCPNNPVVVRFDFLPDDPNASANYLHKEMMPDDNRTLRVGAGMNPSAEYMAVKGITVGSSYRCKRMEETKGSCTPVIFKFYEMNFSDYPQYCW